MIQPNSTARAIVNKALIGMGTANPIATDSLYATGIVDQFGNISSSLDKYQQQAVTFLDMLQQSLALIMNKPFMFRRFQITTQAPNSVTGIGVPFYTIKNTIVEGFRANSFFNVTYGAGPGNPLHVIPYEQFNHMYARPDIVPIGTPLWVVPIPNDIASCAAGTGDCVVRLVPTPDQVYTIEGQCRMVVPPIKSGSDQVAIPYNYEQALIFKLMEVMEGRLNEGREMNMRAYAEQFLAEVLRDSSGAEEEVDRQDVGFTLWGGWKRDSARDYNPATDVVTPYP